MLETFCTVNGIPIGICLRKIGNGLYARFKPATLASLESHFSRLHVEKLTFATRIPHKFPFHPGSNPVLGNRYSALRFSWVDESPGFEVDRYRPMPKSSWDYHDAVFFTTSSPTRSWGALFIHGSLAWMGKSIKLDLFVCCFYWNIDEHRIVVASLSSLEPATGALLQRSLDRLRMEQGQESFNFVQHVFGNDRLVDTITVESALCSPKEVTDGRRCQATVTARWKKEICPGICSNPMTRVDIIVSPSWMYPE